MLRLYTNSVTYNKIYGTYEDIMYNHLSLEKVYNINVDGEENDK